MGPMLFLLSLHLAAFGQAVEVKPVDNGKALNNPNMGWNLAYYTDDGNNYGNRLKKGDVLDWFPGCSTVSFRIGWARIEKQDGVFDWSYTDAIARDWFEQGKQTAFCWINLTTLAQSAPLWLKDLGAKGWTFPGRGYWVPLWDDPIMLERLERFIAAAGKRYNGRPEVSFVEVGSLGTWGEGHNWAAANIRAPEITDSAALSHLHLWRKYFDKTQLFVNDDLLLVRRSGSLERPARVDWMLDNRCGLSDWSVLVDPARPLCVPLMEKVWREQPTLIEHQHYGASMSQGVWQTGKGLLEAVERYHASHLRIHWWPDEFLFGAGKDLPGNKELIDAIDLRLGYRFQVGSFRYPAQIKKGATFAAHLTISNAGVAPCYKGGYASVCLLDASGTTICSGIDAKTDVSKLMPAESADRARKHAIAVSLQPPHDIAPGKYPAVSLCPSVMPLALPYIGCLTIMTCKSDM